MTPFDGSTPEQVDKTGVRAQQQATMRADHAFTSNLTVDEHHAIRSLGFSPVGQVMGSCVYHVGYTGSWNCGYGGAVGSLLATGSPYGSADVVEAHGLRESLYEARMLAVRRMGQECAGLGGDGVVAMLLTIAPFASGGLEFRAIGTAVRAAGSVRPRHPFTSDLSGQDFAKLMTAGWVPCGIALGLSVAIRHDDRRTRRQAVSWSNTEIGGYTRLAHTARRSARARLLADCARSGGTGVVVREASLRVSEQRCPGGGDKHDHLAEAVVIGTSITPFRHVGGNVPLAPLPIMRLR